MDVKAGVKEIICNVLGVEEDEIDDDTMLRGNKQLLFDSIAALDILTALEKKYKLRIPQDRLKEMVNVNSTAQVVESIL